MRNLRLNKDVWANSVRSADRWNKTYFPTYRKNGKVITVTDVPYQRRTEANDRGKELQAQADLEAAAETKRIKDELAALEGTMVHDTVQ